MASTALGRGVRGKNTAVRRRDAGSVVVGMMTAMMTAMMMTAATMMTAVMTTAVMTTATMTIECDHPSLLMFMKIGATSTLYLMKNDSCECDNRINKK